jgi:two-component system, chemotaxis family, CheB/CheR fusion protein
MPPEKNVAFVFVLHMPPTHQSMLAEILARHTRMRVTEVKDEPRVEPNRVYVIPPGRAMVIHKGSLSLSPDPKAAQHRTIDQFLMSLAEDQGDKAIGVILSGTASDGTVGLRAIKAAGGLTFAQDESAQQDGMPKSAIHSGSVDFVLSPAAIAREIAHLADGSFIESRTTQRTKGAAVTEFDQILALLREQSGVDFGQYKANTLQRRIRRRMQLRKLPTLAKYASHLRNDAAELKSLYNDILINVTSFFRDPEAFAALKERVFPELFRNRARLDTVRAWVLGCSTGEESYSLAIALKEYALESQSQVPLLVYATDLNGAGIEKARAGLYPRHIEKDVSPERLRRFFVEADGGYRIAKSIRDICVFARQNVLADPPFSRMDLISCRNVLIYMEPALQRQLMPILHYALKPRAYLFLGPSESTGFGDDLFEAIDPKHKVFRKVATAPRPDRAVPVVPHSRRTGTRPPDEESMTRVSEVGADVQREAERVLLRRYAPAGVLVNAKYEVLQFRGDTGLYLSPAPGKPNHELLKMAREGLLLPLRSALHRAKKTDAPAREESIRVRSDGGFREVVVIVVPVRQGEGAGRCFWVMFEPRPGRAKSERGEQRARKASESPADLAGRDERIEALEQELAATREYLQSVIEQQGAANEELQSANEEVQSSNEELQSINEELETSKEEIQSSNEELTTVNEELQNRNEELNRVNSDLNNIFGSVQMAIVIVWRDLRIRRFTPLAEKLFNLIPSDIGRPISDIKMNLQTPDMRELLNEVIENMVTRELEVHDSQGRWHLMRVRPYRTLDNTIDGAVIALVDIDALKQVQHLVARQALLLEQTHEAIFVCDVDGRIEFWNRGAERIYGYTREEAQGRVMHGLLGSQEEQISAVDWVLQRASQWTGELRHRTRDGREIVVESDQTLIEEGAKTRLVVVNRDITERKRLETILNQRVSDFANADRQKNEFVATLAHELRNPLAPLRNAVEILRNPARNDDDAARTLDLIDRQITKLSRLVDDLLDAARITRGQVLLRKERTDLRVIVQRALETTQDLMRARGQKLSVLPASESLIVDVDPVRIEQVFVNLLNNASKYTRDQGSISVSMDLLRHGEAGRPMAVVRVRDDGVGIEPEMLPRVFDLFTQADRSLARTQGGLGIGLSLVRSLVDLHGGRVAVQSEGPDRGSEFTVSLPALEPGSLRVVAGVGREESGRAPHSAGAQATRVLVVDDNPDIVESTRVMLQLQGKEVRTAQTAAEALDISASFRPSVVLLDIGMPDTDGYAIAARMRQQEGGKELLLIAMTGYGSDEDRERALTSGFDHHLTKPVEMTELERLIGRL